MRNPKRLAGVALVCLLVLSLHAATAAGQDASTPPGHIRFVGENLIATADGEFQRWRITDARIRPDKPGTSFVEIEIDVASLDTGIEKRDEHLRDPDFFDVEKFPTARVRVHDVREKSGAGDGRRVFTATYDVRIRDIEKSLPGEFILLGSTPPTVEGSLVLNRTAFGVGEPHSSFNPLSVDEEIPVRFRATLPAPDPGGTP